MNSLSRMFQAHGDSIRTIPRPSASLARGTNLLVVFRYGSNKNSLRPGKRGSDHLLFCRVYRLSWGGGRREEPASPSLVTKGSQIFVVDHRAS